MSLAAKEAAVCLCQDPPLARLREIDPRIDPTWVLRYDGFDPAVEGRREVLCAVGNGRFATRGAAPESGRSAVSYPGAYAAGVFNRLGSDVAGRRLVHESMVNLPNWLLLLRFRFGDGPWLGLETTEVLDHAQVLDLRHGVLLRRTRFRDDAGRVLLVAQRRLVSMADPYLAALETVLHLEHGRGALQVRYELDGSVLNENLHAERQLDGRHLRVLGSERVTPEVLALDAETVQSRIRALSVSLM